MKGKQITFSELQEKINKRLAAYAGRKYEGTEFHGWYSAEIAKLFAELEIAELRPTTWGVVADFSDAFSYYERVAEIKIDFKRDKRYTMNTRGVILSIAAVFRPEILPLTLDAARRFLLTEQRDEMIKRCEDQRDEAKAEAERCEEQRAELAALVF